MFGLPLTSHLFYCLTHFNTKRWSRPIRNIHRSWPDSRGYVRPFRWPWSIYWYLWPRSDYERSPPTHGTDWGNHCIQWALVLSIALNDEIWKYEYASFFKYFRWCRSCSGLVLFIHFFFDEVYDDYALNRFVKQITPHIYCPCIPHAYCFRIMTGTMRFVGD